MAGRRQNATTPWCLRNPRDRRRGQAGLSRCAAGVRSERGMITTLKLSGKPWAGHAAPMRSRRLRHWPSPAKYRLLSTVVAWMTGAAARAEVFEPHRPFRNDTVGQVQVDTASPGTSRDRQLLSLHHYSSRPLLCPTDPPGMMTPWTSSCLRRRSRPGCAIAASTRSFARPVGTRPTCAAGWPAPITDSRSTRSFRCAAAPATTRPRPRSRPGPDRWPRAPRAAIAT